MSSRGGGRGNRSFRGRRGGQRQNSERNWSQSAQENDQSFNNMADDYSHLDTSTDTVKPAERKFTARCRLFVGNLTNNITEEEFKKMFEPFGETAEVFLNTAKGFGFIKLDTRHNAENAKFALDGTRRDGRILRVKFASNGAAVRVKGLSPWVTNELLENAFSYFGEIERAVVVVNERGRPIGEGIVEFARKLTAANCVKKCSTECFLLTSSPRPVQVEFVEARDEEDGLPEKLIPKNHPEYLKDRELGPRFAEQGTFEYEYGQRWKKLYALENQKRQLLEKEIEDTRRQMEDEMEFTYFDHEANMLREKLRRLEEQKEAMSKNREMREEADRQFDEQIRQTEMMLREREEEILRPRMPPHMEHNALPLNSGPAPNQMDSGFGYDSRMGPPPPPPIPPPPPPMGGPVFGQGGGPGGYGGPGFNHQGGPGFGPPPPPPPPFEQGYPKRPFPPPEHGFAEGNKRRRF